MHRLTREEEQMVAAISAGREWHGKNTTVILGAVLSRGDEPYAVQREIRVAGLLVATLGKRGFIMVRDPHDRAATSRINAILATFYGQTYKLCKTPRGEPFAVHPKLNVYSHKVGPGTTYVPVGEWWEVPGTLNLDPTNVEGYTTPRKIL